MRKKISTTVYLTDDQDTALKRLHNRTKVPMAEYIRRGIDLALRAEGINIVDGQLQDALDILRAAQVQP